MRRVTGGMRMTSRLRKLVAMPLFVVGVAMATGCGAPGLDQVQLDSGPISGTHEAVGGQGIWTFRGIPYAAPPVGELRWQAPQPVKPWQAPRDCTQFGPSCPQPAMLEVFSLSAGLTDEDCLYLNVWSPAKSANERLPVMVWIHGGSFETGSGSMDVYNGRYLATGGVVVVTINYRLGPLGFLSHPALSAQAESGVSGNYGLLDQIAALQWVQRNIIGFGGDPGNVTVFGESAGGISILDLIVSPPAKGLFRRAIVESGLLMDQGFGVKMAASKQQAESAGEVFADRLGVDAAGDVVAQLRAKTVDELMAAAADVSGQADEVKRILFWKPVVDGFVLPDMPTELWSSGQRQQVSLLIGSNADEADLFLPGLVMTEERYKTVVQEIFGVHASEALSLYPGTGPGGSTRAVGRMLTEVGFASSARFAASVMSSEGRDVYLYEFTRAPVPLLMGAFHAVELPYVFGTVDLFSWMGVVGQTDRDLSATIRGYWTRFAATGDPNGGNAPVWPKYDKASDLHLRLGDTVGPAGGLYKDACDLADRVRAAR
jgi:para-nitrobenzyl esterase